MELAELPESAFKELSEYLKDKKIPINKYRRKVGEGRTQCFGMVRKRSLAPDLSRNSWIDPKLHGMLMKFGEMYCPISYTSVQVNLNYKSDAHRDENNKGDSYIVAFGNYTGGELVLDISGNKVSHNIRHRPLLFNGSEILHSTNDFVGRRISLVFHTLVAPPKFPMVRKLSDYETVVENGEYKIALRVPGEEVKYFWKKNGLPHPLKGRTKKQEKVQENNNVINAGLSQAQNLMLSAQQHRQEN